MALKTHYAFWQPQQNEMLLQLQLQLILIYISENLSIGLIMFVLTCLSPNCSFRCNLKLQTGTQSNITNQMIPLILSSVEAHITSCEYTRVLSNTLECYPISILLLIHLRFSFSYTNFFLRYISSVPQCQTIKPSKAVYLSYKI